MATKPVQQQVERILDEEPGRTVAVIVKAREDDRATKAHATAAASAVAERRLTVRSRDTRRRRRRRRKRRCSRC